MYVKNHVIIIWIFLLLSGCSTYNEKGAMTTEEYHLNIKQMEARVELLQVLRNSVQVSTSAQRQLALIEKANATEKSTIPFQGSQYGYLMSQMISVSWDGPIENIVKTIANKVAYSFQVYGVKPKLPILVNVHYVNKPSLIIIRDLDIQARNKAIITIFPKQKLITLRYVDANR